MLVQQPLADQFTKDAVPHENRPRRQRQCHAAKAKDLKPRRCGIERYRLRASARSSKSLKFRLLATGGYGEAAPSGINYSGRVMSSANSQHTFASLFYLLPLYAQHKNNKIHITM